MSIILEWTPARIEIIEIIENGAKRLLWTEKGDARIKHADARLGIGPAVFAGRPEDPDTGVATYDGVIRDALFVFCDYDIVDSVWASVWDVAPAELTAMIDAFMTSHGGDIDAMRALKPTTT